jgi:hypothetical protein
MEAEFLPQTFQTEYTEIVRNIGPGPSDGHISWSLKLQLVDRAGAPDPTNPGSGAAVDLGCNNHGVGIPHPAVFTLTVPMGNYTFHWHHPDAANSYPHHWYNCNHLEEGPHGHQGLVTAVVSDKYWECTATYKGTNSSIPFSYGKADPNVMNGTASTPRCSKIR